mgnify:FL=1|jgi:hypothetical protein
MNRKSDDSQRAALSGSLNRLLRPGLLSDADEKLLRSLFETLYPQSISRLRERYPELTKSDELFCMLIILRQSTSSIALALGILRASVNTARYRLRRKFNLPPDVDLDTFLISGEF